MVDTNGTRDAAAADGTATGRSRYDPAGDATPSESFVLALADFLDVDPITLDPLYETVSPDALDELVATGDPPGVDGHVSFTYADCEVTIHASGLFEFDPLD